MSQYSLVSLFSGAGGMDAGFQMEGGFSMILANDILSSSALTYSENFGHSIINVSEFSRSTAFPVCLLGDVAEVDFSMIDSAVDVVVGGPSCQDFSVVRGTERERQGIKVRRGRLYAHFVRALIFLQPKVFVFENVPGLKSANGGVAYQTILEDFSKLKLRWDDIKKSTGNSTACGVENYFIVFSDIIDAADLGVPQKRKRLIVVGVREDLVSGDWLKASALRQKVQRVLSGENLVFKKYPLTPLEAFEGRPLPELQSEYAEIMKEYKGVGETVGTERAKKWLRTVWRRLSFDVTKDYIFLNHIRNVRRELLDVAFQKHTELLKELGYYQNRLEGRTFPDNSNAVPEEAEDVLERLRMIPPGENHEFVRGTKWEVEGRGISLIYRRLNPLRPSYTIVAYGGGGTWGYHYKRSRGRLTNRERARLQTFPDSFLFRGSSAEVRAQIGEAVPPLLGRRIAKAVKVILSEVC
ncbi:MAG: DNA cytosine methyltransferase [Thermoproteota archaeon]